jgi:hypothetical protein
VSGAKVSYHGVTKRTNRYGKASFRIAKGTPRGVKRIAFGRAGYGGGTATFRVTG